MIGTAVALTAAMVLIIAAPLNAGAAPGCDGVVDSGVCYTDINTVPGDTPVAVDRCLKLATGDWCRTDTEGKVLDWKISKTHWAPGTVVTPDYFDPTELQDGSPVTSCTTPNSGSFGMASTRTLSTSISIGTKVTSPGILKALTGNRSYSGTC